MADDIVINIDVRSAEALAATSAYDKAMQRVSANLSLAAKAQAKYDAAVASSGASSDKATAAQVRLGAALARTTEAEQRAAIAAAKSGEIQAAASAKAAAAADKAAAAQTAAAAKVASSRKAQASSLLASTTGFSASTTGALALGAAFIYATKSAADFDQKLATIRALTPGADISALSAAAGKYSDLGLSASDAADAEIELTKAGISVKDILGGGLQGTLTLAAAGQLDVADATSIAAQAMTEFALKGSDLPHIADLLSAGANKALGSVQDLGVGLSYAGGPAHALGVSIEDTVATLAEFAQAGLIGEKGGAALQTMFARLVKPTGAASDELKKYNITLYDAKGQFVGMSALAGEFQQNMGDLSLETRNAALQTIFGNRAFRAAAILYNDGADGAAKWRDNVTDAGNASRTASGKMDSLNGDLQKLKANLVNLATAQGQSGQAPIRNLTQDVTAAIPLVGKLNDLYGGLNSLTFGGINQGLNPIGSGLDAFKGLSDFFGGGGGGDSTQKSIALMGGLGTQVQQVIKGVAAAQALAAQPAARLATAQGAVNKVFSELGPSVAEVSLVAPKLRTTGSAADGAAGSLEHLAAAAHHAMNAMLGLNNLALNKRGDWASYQDAIAAANDELKKNGPESIKAGTDAGNVLDGMAASANQFAANFKAGSKGQIAYLEKARASLYQMALAFTHSKKEARDYVDTVLRIPDDAKTKADFDSIQAKADIKDLQHQYSLTPEQVKTIVTADGATTAIAQVKALHDWVDRLHGASILIGVTTQYTSQGTSAGGGGHVVGGSDIIAQHASGGPIGGVGTGTSDSNLIRASRGEHMLTKREVDNAGGHAAIFAMRRGWQSPMQGMAMGGVVGRSGGGGSTTHTYSTDLSPLIAEIRALKTLVAAGIKTTEQKPENIARVVQGTAQLVVSRNRDWQASQI